MKIKKICCYTAFVIGLTFIFGAAGGSDIGIFSIGQVLWRIALGIILIGGGYICH